MRWDLETNTRFHPAIVWKRKKQHPIYVIAVMLGYAIFRMTNNTKKKNSSSSNNININMQLGAMTNKYELGAMTNKYDHRKIMDGEAFPKIHGSQVGWSNGSFRVYRPSQNRNPVD